MFTPTCEGGSIKSGWISKEDQRSSPEEKNENREHLGKVYLIF